jgi:predicted phage tail protein
MTATNRLAPRGGTIFWGAVLLLLATAAGITALVGTWSWTAVIWLIVAFGALMVVAGLIGGVARAVTPARATSDQASTDRLTPNSTDAPLT